MDGKVRIIAARTWSMPMRIVPCLLIAGLVALATPVRAELPDCATFPNDRSRFACYDAISRATKPEPKDTVKANAAKPKSAIARERRLVGTD
jgi:hypothetical protein